MSIQKLKNRVKSLETELFGLGGRIPKEEQFLVVGGGDTEAERERVKKEFERLKAGLREKYGDFDDTDVMCARIIERF